MNTFLGFNDRQDGNGGRALKLISSQFIRLPHLTEGLGEGGGTRMAHGPEHSLQPSLRGILAHLNVFDEKLETAIARVYEVQEVIRSKNRRGGQGNATAWALHNLNCILEDANFTANLIPVLEKIAAKTAGYQTEATLIWFRKLLRNSQHGILDESLGAIAEKAPAQDVDKVFCSLGEMFAGPQGAYTPKEVFVVVNSSARALLGNKAVKLEWLNAETGRLIAGIAGTIAKEDEQGAVDATHLFSRLLKKKEFAPEWLAMDGLGEEIVRAARGIRRRITPGAKEGNHDFETACLTYLVLERDFTSVDELRECLDVLGKNGHGRPAP